MTIITTQNITNSLKIANSKSTLHLAIKLFAILIIVYVATTATTPNALSRWYSKQSSTQPIYISNPQYSAWVRAAIITITALLMTIIVITMKGGKIYPDDLVFMGVLGIYCLYWWVQWQSAKEAFINSDGSGGDDGASILATGLSNEEWHRMATGRTWSRDLAVSDKNKLIAGINRPEHYDYAPDDMRLYRVDPYLANAEPTVGVLAEMDDADLIHKDVRGAGHGVSRQYKELDGPLPDGRTELHTQYVEQQVNKVLAPEHRGHGPANGLPSELFREPFNSNTCNSILTPDMHNKWLAEYGYTYLGMGGDAICGDLRKGCKQSSKGECRNPHYCSNWPPLTSTQVRKLTRGGEEILRWP